jgi:hypothetical protein
MPSMKFRLTTYDVFQSWQMSSVGWVAFSVFHNGFDPAAYTKIVLLSCKGRVPMYTEPCCPVWLRISEFQISCREGSTVTSSLNLSHLYEGLQRSSVCDELVNGGVETGGTFTDAEVTANGRPISGDGASMNPGPYSVYQESQVVFAAKSTVGTCMRASLDIMKRSTERVAGVSLAGL